MAAKKRRKLTPAQRAVALKNLAKARRARKAKTAGKAAPARRRKRPLTDKRRKALGYRKETTMAKKKKRATSKKRRRGGGRRASGFFAGVEWMDMAGAAAYGLAEKQVGEKGDQALLKKLPLFYEGIGYAGCSAILAHFAGKQLGGTIGKALRHYAKGTFDVAAYKLAKHGKLYASKDEADAALAGDDDLGYDDDLGADDDEIGIELEGDEGDEVGYGADGIS